MLKMEAITGREMQSALFDASEAINKCDGWVTNHKLYSNTMAMVAFEIPASRINNLAETLMMAKLPVSWNEEKETPESDDVSGQLVLTFAKGDLNQRREVPAFD